MAHLLVLSRVGVSPPMAKARVAAATALNHIIRAPKELKAKGARVLVIMARAKPGPERVTTGHRTGAASSVTVVGLLMSE